MWPPGRRRWQGQSARWPAPIGVAREPLGALEAQRAATEREGGGGGRREKVGKERVRDTCVCVGMGVWTDLWRKVANEYVSSRAAAATH